MSKVSDMVQECIQPILQNLGIELVEVEFKKVKNENVLTVYIDKDGGVSLDDCELAHNAIDQPLDDLDPTNGQPYTLNVSSPGLDRPLKTERDYKKNLEKEVELSMYKPVDGLKKFTAVLKDFDLTEQIITVLVNKNTIQLNIKDIALIRAVIKF